MCTIYCYKYRIHSNFVNVCYTNSETELLEIVWSNFFHTVMFRPCGQSNLHDAYTHRRVTMDRTFWSIWRRVSAGLPSTKAWSQNNLPLFFGGTHLPLVPCMALRHVATIHQYTPWRGSVRTFAEFYTKLIGLRGRFSAIRKTRPNQSDPTPRKQWLETVHDSPSLSLSLIFKFPRNNYLKSKMTLSAAFSAIHLHSPSKLGPRSIPHRLFELLNRRLQQLTKVRQCTLAAVNAPEKSLASRRYPVVTW